MRRSIVALPAVLAGSPLVGEIESPSICDAALTGSAFFTDPRAVSTSRGDRPGDGPWSREIRPDTDLVPEGTRRIRFVKDGRIVHAQAGAAR